MADFYIGWDVGAWKCSKGRGDSCDAIVILDDKRIVGHHRDNISSILYELYKLRPEERAAQLINRWLDLAAHDDCDLRYSTNSRYFVAIDTPLGWPKDFKALLERTLQPSWSYNDATGNINNTLLYRYTEREKLRSGLSVIVDSIGSQSVKGIFLLQVLEAKEIQWGVWKTGNITFFETYPKACLVRPSFVQWMVDLKLEGNLQETFKKLVKKNPQTYTTSSVITEDVFDATVCACVARAFATGTPKLTFPTNSDPDEYRPEGWIYYPDQGSEPIDQRVANGHKAVTCCEDKTSFHEALMAFQKHFTSASSKQNGDMT